MEEPLLALWPLAATMAVVVAARWRASRRRTALNRALHELRRPLQALALGGAGRRDADAGPTSLELALAALDDLDAAINGITVSPVRRPVAARGLVEGVVSRWRDLAGRRDARLVLEWRTGPAVILADPARVAQALDNLLANAIEHGRGPISISAARSPVGLRVRVRSRRSEARRALPDRRRGHGLAVVERVATAHLGRFRIRSDGDEVIADLELPLAATALPAVPIEWPLGEARQRPGALGPAPSRAA